MSDSKIVDRIRKLLALSKSDNVNEAAMAAARAQELMQEYQIEMADISVQTGQEMPREDAKEQVLEETGSRSKALRWRVQLAGTLARAFNGRIYYTQGTDRIVIIARPSDAQTVRYLLGFLAIEIERLCSKEWAALMSEYKAGEYQGLQPPRATAWKNSFRDGAVHAIAAKLREKEVPAAASPPPGIPGLSDSARAQALVLVKKADEIALAQVEAAMKKHFPRGGRRSGFSAPTSADGYGAGKRAGATISWSTDKAIGGGGAKRLAR
jgi:hypothetical protein